MSVKVYQYEYEYECAVSHINKLNRFLSLFLLYIYMCTDYIILILVCMICHNGPGLRLIIL